MKRNLKTAFKHETLVKENEALREELLDLQTEFDLYKQNKTKELMEYKDKVEKIEALEAELEQFHVLVEQKDTIATYEKKIESL